MQDDKSIPEKIQRVLDSWYGDHGRDEPADTKQIEHWFKATRKILKITMGAYYKILVNTR